jgi:hypothetical protein
VKYIHCGGSCRKAPQLLHCGAEYCYNAHHGTATMGCSTTTLQGWGLVAQGSAARLPAQPSTSPPAATAVQCSAVQCSAVQCSAVQCSAVQCSAVQCKMAGDYCSAHNLTQHYFLLHYSMSSVPSFPTSLYSYRLTYCTWLVISIIPILSSAATNQTKPWQANPVFEV